MFRTFVLITFLLHIEYRRKSHSLPHNFLFHSNRGTLRTQCCFLMEKRIESALASIHRVTSWYQSRRLCGRSIPTVLPHVILLLLPFGAPSFAFIYFTCKIDSVSLSSRRNERSGLKSQVSRLSLLFLPFTDLFLPETERKKVRDDAR